MSLNFFKAWKNDKLYNKRVLKFIGYQFGAKLVFCAKYDRELDLGFWEILKPLKWTNITSFFLIKTNVIHLMQLELNLIFNCFKLAYVL
jgi:hypothetical protein